MAENGARRIRLGMVGGGTGAFIGYVHRIAARLDDDYELVAGALSSRPEVSKESGKNIGLDASTASMARYEEMARQEAARPDGIEAVSIVTPNHVHAGPGQGVSRSRHPCDLRQAADVNACRRPGAWRRSSRRTAPSFC